MSSLPIGVIIKEIVHKKNLSPARLAGKTGLTRQAVYNTYSRSSMNEDDLEKWAAALDMSVKELLEYGSNKVAPVNADIKSENALAELKKMFEQELREKNEQIRALQEALRQAQNLSTALLGKSPERPGGRILSNVFTRVSVTKIRSAVR